MDIDWHRQVSSLEGAALISKLKEDMVRPEVYLYSPFVTILAEKGIAAAEPIYKVIKVFQEGTYKSFKESEGRDLQPREVGKLKELSLLDLLVGRSEIRLGSVEKQLGINRKECLQMLLTMSMSKLISVDVNEPEGKMEILQAKLRERQAGLASVASMQSRLQTILKKNAGVVKELVKAVQKSKPPRIITAADYEVIPLRSRLSNPLSSY